MSNIVQYIIVRKDLRTSLNWSLGAIIAQCCHATTAINYINDDDPITKKYFNNLDNMHKVILAATDEEDLLLLSKKLNENDIKYKLWIEQPENIPTCIAIKPYVKDSIHGYVKHLKLLK